MSRKNNVPLQHPRSDEKNGLQGRWLITERYYCYGNEDYPDEEYITAYETPVWDFRDDKAEFKDLAFPFSMAYKYRLDDNRLLLQPLDGSPEELYRVHIAGNRATLYMLEQTWQDDGASRCLTETIRIELKRLKR